MTLLGRWRIVEMPDYEEDYPDLSEPAFIHFTRAGGTFAFGCVTGAIAFDWDGSDEMDPASGDGWAELRPDGTLEGAICFHDGDEANFIARRWTSSTTC